MHDEKAKLQDLNWNDLRYILSVGRTGSLAKAARKLGVNESTVGRRISRIEMLLEAKLFERNPNGLIPTSAGSSTILAAEHIENHTQSLISEISGSDQRVSGNVRVTSVPIILNQIIVPALPKLLSDYPYMDVELIADSRNLNLTKRHADIAVRLSRPSNEPRIVARKIGKLDYAVYTSSNEQQLTPWINYEEDMLNLPQAQWIAKQVEMSGNESQLKVNDAESILAYLKNGTGKSLLPVFIGDKVSKITRISSEVVLTREIWLLVHPDIKELGQIRKTMDWLIILFRNL